jgi:hypothetical protein
VLKAAWHWGSDSSVLNDPLGFISAERGTRKLIVGLSPTVKNRTKSSVVIGLFIGHNALRRHCYLMGLSSSPDVGGVEQRERPQPTFCVSTKLWFHSDIRICVCFFWT